MRLGRLICVFTLCLSFSFGKNLPKGIEVLKQKQAFFVGRQSELQLIHQHLKESHSVILSGPQGIGKSCLAANYAMNHAQNYNFIWWYDGEINFPKNIQSLAVACGIPTKHIGLNEIVRAVGAYIENSKDQRFLFIFNNIDAHESIVRYMPFLNARSNVDVIVTSLSSSESWSAHGKLCVIGGLDPLDSALILNHHIESRQSPKLILELAKRLGGLPISLCQASAYLNKTNMPLKDYLESLGKNLKGLSVWDAALKEVKVSSPLSIELLELSSFLDPSYIPGYLFERLCESRSGYKKAVNTLRKYSLIESHKDGFKVHQLLQEAFLCKMDLKRKRECLLKLIYKLNLEFTYYHKGAKPDKKCRVLAGQLACVLAAAKEKKLSSPIYAALCRKLGDYILFEQHDYERSIGYLSEALNTEKELSGSPQIIADLTHKIGYAQLKWGHFSEADIWLKAAKKQLLALYPNENQISVAGVYHDLAKLSLYRGFYAESQALFERALQINRKYYGNDDHQSIGRNLHWLGHLRLAQGDFAEAIELFNKSITIEKTIHESDVSRYSAESFLSLGKAHTELNHFQIAKGLFYKALAMDLLVYPDQNSPLRGSIYHWIGKIHTYLGDYASASYYLREALSLHMRLLRTQNHLQVAATLRLLGRLALIQSDYRSARAYFTKVEKISSQFRENRPHPRDARILVYLGKLESAEGNYKSAIDYFQKALKVYSQVDGGLKNFVHRESTIKLNMGLVELELGNVASALLHIKEANELALRCFSSEANRITARTLRAHAMVEMQKGDFDKASQLVEKAEKIFCELYPSRVHLEYAETLMLKGEIAYKFGNYSTSQNIFKQATSIIREVVKEPAKNFLYCQGLVWKARIAYRRGKYSHAKELLFQVKEHISRIFPDKVHVSHALVSHFLGDVLWAEGSYKQAEDYVDRAIECYKKSYGDTAHSHLIDAWITLGKVVLSQGRYDDARTYLNKAVQLANRRTCSSFDLRKGKGYFWLGCLEKKLGNFMRAEVCHRKGLYALENVYGEKIQHPFKGYVCFEIADDLFRQNKPKAARYYLSKAQKFDHIEKYPPIKCRYQELKEALAHAGY